MKINIGSTNPAKIDAVQELDRYFDFFKIEIINAFKVPSFVADQPLSLEETVTGAQNRAINAFNKGGADVGIGLEAGIYKLLDDYFLINAASIYDGKDSYNGLGFSIKLPNKLIKRIIDHKEEMVKALVNSGYTDDEDIGKKQGMVYVFSGGKFTRKQFGQSAIISALINMKNKN